jgi:DNA-binding transcriptional ArsR family regulator
MLVESAEGKQRIYDSLLLKPEHLGIFSNELAVSIINELAKQPACAMDIAKRLKQNEQKIYYHLRKMRNAGIVKLNGTEQRFGMIAKLFELVSPVIATKLYEDGYKTDRFVSVKDPEMEKFLSPFISKGRLNTKIIIGTPIPHGKYEATARDGVHALDFALFLGKFVDGFNESNYKMDVEVDKHRDLKDNLILIGGPKINTIVDMVNDHLPIYFDPKKEWTITSRLTKNTYNYDDDAVILKVKNPFNKKKELLLLAGRRSRGLRSAVIAFTQHINDVMKGNIENPDIIAKVVRGIDRQGNGIVDSVTFME